jgi:hypothetical protein
MTPHVTIHTILVEEYVPKRNPIHPFIIAILYFLVFYLCDVVMGMYQ